MESNRSRYVDVGMSLTSIDFGDADGLGVQGRAASVHPAFARESKADYTPRWRPTPRKQAEDFESWTTDFFVCVCEGCHQWGRVRSPFRERLVS